MSERTIDSFSPFGNARWRIFGGIDSDASRPPVPYSFAIRRLQEQKGVRDGSLSLFSTSNNNYWINLNAPIRRYQGLEVNTWAMAEGQKVVDRMEREERLRREFEHQEMLNLRKRCQEHVRREIWKNQEESRRIRDSLFRMEAASRTDATSLQNIGGR